MATNNSVNVPLSGNTGTGNFVGATSPTLITPTLGVATATSLEFSGNNGILDSNGKEILSLNPAGSSAVNYMQIGNANTLSPPGIIAVGSDTNIPLQFQGKGNGGVENQGISSGGNKPAGYVGEIITSTLNTQAISNNTITNITSINLTAGLWRITGAIFTNPATGTTQTEAACGINTNSTPALPAFYGNGAGIGATISLGVNAPSILVNISTTTTYYLVAYVVYTVSTLTINATITGIRVA